MAASLTSALSSAQPFSLGPMAAAPGDGPRRHFSS